jgi:glycine/D-amino acid oxidase-like deaminating enzyme
LSKRGATVTILERERPGSGATGKSLAWLNASSKQPRYLYDLNVLGLDGWRRLQLELGAALQVQWGGAVEWRPLGGEADRLRQTVRRNQRWGCAIRLVDDAELRRLVPSISPGPVAAAYHCEQEATVDPEHVLGTILRKAQEFGADVRYPCEVSALDFAVDRVRGIKTTQGTIEADVLVLAAGTGTPHLARMAECDVPLVHSPGALAHTGPQPRLLDRLVLAPSGFIKQNRDGRIVASGSPRPDDRVTTDQGEQILREAARYLPHLQRVPLERVTLGYRVLPQDGFPIIGFAGNWRNLYVAAMHSGMTLAPVIGHLAALEILDAVDVDMLEPFRLSRFASPGQ